MNMKPTALALFITSIYGSSSAFGQAASPTDGAASAPRAATTPAVPPSAAAAQNDTGSETHAARGVQDTGLVTVIVTGQKRKENAQKAAISLSAIDGASISESGENTLQNVLSAVPGVVIQEQSRGFAPSIRGLGTDLPPGIGDGSVATNYDGSYNVRAEGSQSMFDLARVEVLRGPQSTLYGRSGPAGVVNVVTNDPTFKFGGSATAEAGNFGLFRSELVLNSPLGSNLAIRGALTTQHRDGYLSNGTEDAGITAGRVKLLYKPSDDLSLLLGVESINISEKGSGAVEAYSTEPSNPWEAPAADGQFDHYQGHKYWVQLDANLGFGTLTALASTSRARDNLYIPVGNYAVDGQDPKNLRQNSVEIRLASRPESDTKWMVGVYQYINAGTVSTVPAGSAAGTTEDVQHTSANSKAIFANVTVPAAAGLRAIGGVRYTQDKRAIQANLYEVPGVIPAENEAGTFNKVDGKLGLELDVNPDSLLYATVSTGYRPGGWNFDYPYSKFQPETLISYELGSKNQFLNKRARLNASIYYYDYKNYQVQDVYFPAGQAFPNIEFLNVPKVRNFGGELEAAWQATQADTISATLSYVNATFRSDIDTHASAFAPAQNLNGRPLPHSPKLTVAGYYLHSFYTDIGSLDVRLDMRHVSSQYVSPNEFDLSYQKAYFTGDFSMIYRPDSDKWSLSAYVKNINNVAVKTSYNTATNTAAGAYAANTIAPPRTYGVVGIIKF